MTGDIDPIALIRQAAADAINAQAQLAEDRTRERAPKDTTELDGSFDVDPATSSDPNARLFSDSAYARYQHEALYLEHPSGGQPKFMESAVIGGDSARVLGQAAADAARRTLGG